MRRLPLYPFLFVLYFVLTPLANNLDQLNPAQALRPLAILLLAALVILVLFQLLVRDWGYAGYLLFLVCLFALAFGSINRLVQDFLARFNSALDGKIFLAVYTIAMVILGIRWVWSRLGGRSWLTPYMNLVMAIGLLFPAYRLVSGFVRDPYQSRQTVRNVQASGSDLSLDCTNTPDIYYIILDGYGRADALRELYGFDNGPFLEYLRHKGFYIASESHTNYTQTFFSIPSSLNFDYIAPPEEGINEQMYFSDLMRNNHIMSLLKGCGYRTVAIESGYSFTDHPIVDVYLTRGIGYNEFESLLLADSPVDVLAEPLNLKPPEFSFEAHRQRVLYGFGKLQNLPRMKGPKIVFAHIISPHPPFVFDASGRLIEPESSYYIGDGDDFQGSLEEYLKGYPEQVQFVNHMMERVVNALLERSSALPIIIIQGDHGPGSRLVWEGPDQTCLWERTPILDAYYFPEGGERFLYPSISPVNSFRVVLNAYFKANLPLLPDETYFTSHRLERQAIDITDKRNSRANCGLP